MWKYMIFSILLIPGAVFAAPDSENTATQEVVDHDKDTDIFYKFGGGIRLRQYFWQDSTAGVRPFEEDSVSTAHRAQLDLQLNKGEYFKTFFRAVHASEWGDNNANNDDFTLVQAWGDWKVTDFLNLKFGRQPIELGRGLQYGLNEWENIPSYYDSFSTLFDWDVMELSLYAVRVYELDRDPANSIANDPEMSHYIIDVNFRELSDLIQMADLSFIQVVSDIGTIPGTTTLLKKQRSQRFGFDLVLAGVYFETAASINYVTGTEETLTVSEKVKQLMMDAELRLMLPDFDRFNFWVGAHYDSGDDDAADGNNTQYAPLNYNFHQNAGRMDFFKFGNLTYLRTGFSMHLLSDWYFGTEGFMFQKTKEGAPNFLEAASPLVNDFANGTVSFGNAKDLGTELDIWIGKTFPSGVNLELTLSYLKPGEAMDTAFLTAGPTPQPMDDPIYRMTFDLGMFF